MYNISMFYEVIPAKIFRKDADFLTYSYHEPLSPGTIVQIPLGRSSVTGIVFKKVAQPKFATKPISKILYSTPLPAHLLATLKFFKDFYLIPMPTALSLLLPNGIEKKRRNSLIFTAKTEQPSLEAQIPLGTAQKNALKALQKAPEGTKLLHGVTGSGKTNIYLKMAENALKQQKSTILLVPEIALTSQLVRVFEDTFKQKVTLIHSGITESERHQIWQHLLTAPADSPQIVIGPRSALFAPLANLGLIIVDECHEPSYYQENTPKYSAIRAASFIANNLKINCILGSATPALQDYYLAKTKNVLVSLTEKAKTTAFAPTISIIDLRNRSLFTKNRYFSTPLINQIHANLQKHEQTLIFHNRRGSSPLSLCENCGEQFLCPTCLLPLTLHADSYELLCHTCGYHQKVPHSCPKCGSPNILHKGFGTKLLETELKKLFKGATIPRFDADNKKTDSLDALYDDVKSGKIDIIIGTQSVAKGLDLPNLATVGIIQADAGLSLPDYSAEERVFELITQVIGRVGRGHLATADVFIQTFKPDADTLKYAINQDFVNFADYLLKKRQNTAFPPFTYLAKVEITLKTESLALQKIRKLYQQLSINPKLSVSVPTPAFHEHTIKGYTWQLTIRAKSRTAILSAIKDLDPNFRLTLDPPSLL